MKDKIIKNFSHAAASNLIAILVSIFVILIIPKFIGVTEYGYFQLYIFYSTYAGFLHFGLSDGIYLRYGGEKYEDLNKQKFFSQFMLMAIVQTLILFISILYFSGMSSYKSFIFMMVFCFSWIVNIRSVLLFTLQATNRIQEYARSILISRGIYLGIVLILLLVGEIGYKQVVIADLIGNLGSLIFVLIACREIVFRKISSFYMDLSETLENIRAGIKLMFSNIASILVLGVVRFTIERLWSIETFGKVSLTLSISNFMLVFVNALGVVIFPFLKNLSEKTRVHLYLNLRLLITTLLLGILLIYTPAKWILSEWLPQYQDTLRYMALLFPMFVYEGRMALIINTYLKSLRKENVMLKVNIIVLLVSLGSVAVSAVMFHTLEFTVLLIMALSALKCLILEFYLASTLKMSLLRDNILESVLIVTFIVTSWNFESLISFSIYAILFLIYIMIKKNNLQSAIKNLKSGRVV